MYFIKMMVLSMVLAAGLAVLVLNWAPLVSDNPLTINQRLVHLIQEGIYHE